MMNIKVIGSLLLALVFMSACTPEVGSRAWCHMMKEKPKGEWTANQMKNFGRHCLIR